MRFAVAWMSVALALVEQSPTGSVPPQAVPGTATVAGTVFTGDTGTNPARKTRVMLASLDSAISGQTVSTDDEGRFEFRNVTAGRYRVEVQKAGFLRASYGARRSNRSGTPLSVTDGSRTEGLTIRLVHGAAISGTVRDARGRPMPGISVSALRHNYSVLGELRLTAEGSATTDDQGAYRVWGLQPGHYLIAAIPGVPGGFGAFQSNDFTLLTTADVDRALQGGAWPSVAPQQTASTTSTYSPVFAPGTSDAAQATSLEISAAEDRDGVDVVVSLVRTARLHGVVTRRDGLPPGSARITLGSAGDAANLLTGNRAWAPRTATLDTQGRFTFFDVPAGTYRLVALLTAPANPTAASAAEPGAMWAMSEVSVNGVDLGVSLTLQPAMTVTGQVVFNGSSPPPDDPTLDIRLVPPGGSISSGPSGGSVDANRTFSFAGVIPGDYRILTITRSQWRGNWFLRSAIVNGRDVLDGSLRIAPGDRTELVLTYSDKPTEVIGQFTDLSGLPATDYFIVVFPADRAQWLPGSRRILSTRPGNDGQYSIRGLPPGEYLLAALTDLDPEDLFSPSFFEQLTPLAIKVTLAEGQLNKQDLTIRR